jgi:hypothetical protein
LVFAAANHPPEIPTDLLKAAQIPDDGILTTDEMASLPLNGVRLVLLSACEAGLGEVAGGEALMGFSGLAEFGASGIILGPVPLAIADALIDVWKRRTAFGGTLEDGVANASV